ncbi:MAG: hypothetical protein HKN24_14165 [Acidimicrobiales bacterium]|nr:hypothetical protein [Acidimicrobiales bacterium]
MPFVAWVTVIIAFLIIFFAAVGLLRVVLHLRAVDQTLEAVVGGVDVIAQKTSTVPEVVPSVNANLAPVRSFADSI